MLFQHDCFAAKSGNIRSIFHQWLKSQTQHLMESFQKCGTNSIVYGKKLAKKMFFEFQILSLVVFFSFSFFSFSFSFLFSMISYTFPLRLTIIIPKFRVKFKGNSTLIFVFNKKVKVIKKKLHHLIWQYKYIYILKMLINDNQWIKQI